MGRGPAIRRICVICGQNTGKPPKNRWVHIREVHGGKALTKSKALELYPAAERSPTVDALPGEMTVWVIEREGFHKMWGELDLFNGAEAVVKQVARSLTQSPVRVDPPPPERKHKSSLGRLHSNLKKLQRTLKKADQLMDEILEGES